MEALNLVRILDSGGALAGPTADGILSYLKFAPAA